MAGVLLMPCANVVPVGYDCWTVIIFLAKAQCLDFNALLESVDPVYMNWNDSRQRMQRVLWQVNHKHIAQYAVFIRQNHKILGKNLTDHFPP